MEAPPAYQPQFVPMQGPDNKDGRVNPTGEVQQHTTVIINTLPPPRDHIIWSICSMVYMNPCCLGLVALYFSVKSRDGKLAGNMDTAREYGSTARILNIIALSLIVITGIGVIIYYSVAIAALSRMRHG